MNEKRLNMSAVCVAIKEVARRKAEQRLRLIIKRMSDVSAEQAHAALTSVGMSELGCVIDELAGGK